MMLIGALLSESRIGTDLRITRILEARYLSYQTPDIVAQRSGLIETEIIARQCWYLPSDSFPSTASISRADAFGQLVVDGDC